MSKKSRKKSPKTLSRRPPRAKPPKASNASKGRAAKVDRPVAGASSRKRTGGGSHKGASKRLKSGSAAASGPRNADSSVETAHALIEGAKAPPFRLTRDGGGTIELSNFAGKKLVLFFYPRADTPGCTREAMDFTRLKAAFADCGTEVVGISADPQRAQERFRDKHKLEVPLISDEQHQTLEAYGAWGEKSMYGRIFLGVIRTTELIGRDGRVARIWRHVKVEGHAEQVLEAARAL
jgi:thioredoxin-dependent peroxiredoxin